MTTPSALNMRSVTRIRKYVMLNIVWPEKKWTEFMLMFLNSYIGDNFIPTISIDVKVVNFITKIKPLNDYTNLIDLLHHSQHPLHIVNGYVILIIVKS